MKKIGMIVMAMIMSLSMLMAQNNYAGSSKFTDNWSVSVGAGLQTNLNDWHGPQGAVIDLSLTRQITPIFGAGVESGLGVNNLGNWYDHHVHQGTAFDNVYVLGNVYTNLNNCIWAYEQPCAFEIETVTGLGWMHDYNGYGSGNNALVAKTGLNLNYNVTDAWTVQVQPSVMWNLSEHKAFCSNHAVGQILLTGVYHFKTSNGTHHMTRARLYDYDEVDGLNDEIGRLRRHNNALRNQKPVVKEVEKIVVKNVRNEYIVMFAKASYELTDEAKDLLDQVPTNVSVQVAGYASPEGNKAFNDKLSMSRASVVAEYLTKRGVKVVSTKAVGVANNASNRVAIVTVE